MGVSGIVLVFELFFELIAADKIVNKARPQPTLLSLPKADPNIIVDPG